MKYFWILLRNQVALWPQIYLIKINLWSKFQTIARPGFSTEFKNISHKCYLAIIKMCLQASGDSKKIGYVYYRVWFSGLLNINFYCLCESLRNKNGQLLTIPFYALFVREKWGVVLNNGNSWHVLFTCEVDSDETKLLVISDLLSSLTLLF